MPDNMMPDSTPIQEAVAWYRDKASRLRHAEKAYRMAGCNGHAEWAATDAAKYIRWADAIEALTAEVERLRGALREIGASPVAPTLTPSKEPLRMADDLSVWPEGRPPLTLLRPGERIRVRYKNWRGEIAVRDIELDGVPHWGRTEWHPEPCWLIAGTDIVKGEQRVWSIADMQPIPDTNPSEDQDGADRDAAVTTTHLPASAPPLGSPAPRNHALERLRLVAADTGPLTGHTQIDAREAAAIQAEIERLHAALKAARDLIAEMRDNDLGCFTVGGDPETMDDSERAVIAEYDGVLAQIDGAANG